MLRVKEFLLSFGALNIASKITGAQSAVLIFRVNISCLQRQGLRTLTTPSFPLLPLFFELNPEQLLLAMPGIAKIQLVL